MQLAGVCVRGAVRACGRGQPGLLHQPHRQRAAGGAGAARAAQPRAMDGRGAGRRRRAVAHGAGRPAAVDRAGAGRQLRPLRADAQDLVAGRHGRPGAGNAAAVAAGAAAAGLVDVARPGRDGAR